eukprot:Partr_v1_DN28372_c0_g1_i2_m78822 putative dual-specificity tyrosine-(Y)-phosphorylation regulated kinase
MDNKQHPLHVHTDKTQQQKEAALSPSMILPSPSPTQKSPYSPTLTALLRHNSLASTSASVSNHQAGNSLLSQEPPAAPTAADNGIYRSPNSSFKRFRADPLPCISASQGILRSMSLNLLAVYQICNPEHFRYSSSLNPRRVLTKPSQGLRNHGWDNRDSDYILYVNDLLGDKEGQKYIILDLLGQGTFGQVVKAQNIKTREIVAIKVIKNKPAYTNQSTIEIQILDLLNKRFENVDEGQNHLVTLLDSFFFRRHLCLVFELLSVNLYELIKQNQFRGLSINLVRLFATQILSCLCVLADSRIIHCDLKPENVLLKNLDSPDVKVIDFGSACHEHQTVYTYIQSRFYRSPEVLLGLPYSSSIDMWSLGCILAELYLGLPLFPGASEYNQICRIVEMLGHPPTYMLEFGKNTKNYYDKIVGPDMKYCYALKSIEQYNLEKKASEKPSKRYFTARSLRELIFSYPLSKSVASSKPAMDREMNMRECFLDFIGGLLNLNPLERWSPYQARLHPFITGTDYTGPFMPPMEFHGRYTATSESQPSSPAVNFVGSPMGDPYYRSRPRANTISAGKLGTIPPQLQKLASISGGMGMQITDGHKYHRLAQYPPTMQQGDGGSNSSLNNYGSPSTLTDQQLLQYQQQQQLLQQHQHQSAEPNELRRTVNEFGNMHINSRTQASTIRPGSNLNSSQNRKNRSYSVTDRNGPTSWMQTLGPYSGAPITPSSSRTSLNSIDAMSPRRLSSGNLSKSYENIGAQGSHDALKSTPSVNSLAKIHEHEEYQATTSAEAERTGMYQQQQQTQQFPHFASPGNAYRQSRRLSAPTTPNLTRSQSDYFSPGPPKQGSNVSRLRSSVPLSSGSSMRNNAASSFTSSPLSDPAIIAAMPQQSPSQMDMMSPVNIPPSFDSPMDHHPLLPPTNAFYGGPPMTAPAVYGQQFFPPHQLFHGGPPTQPQEDTQRRRSTTTDKKQREERK